MDLTEEYRPIFGKVLLSLLVSAVLLPTVAAAQSPTPSIFGLLPNSVKAGSAGITLNVLGSQFVPGAVVQWNGAGRVTNYFSATLLEAAIPASDLATGGTIQITVVNPGGVVSNAMTFLITTGNPVPVLTAISPARMQAGGDDFTLHAIGENFTEQSVVLWNGETRQTTFVDSKNLAAQITAEDIATPGTALISVRDDAPGGGTSSALEFTISAFVSSYFTQVAVDGGYTTTFTIINTGGIADEGFLTLTDQAGNPFTVSATEPSSPAISNSIIPISIPALGVKIITVNAPGSSGPTPKVGWARLDSSTGMLNGVATFQTRQGSVLTSVAGVLPTQPQSHVTIPIDNDLSVGRRTGFAIGNPDANTIRLSITVLDEGGNQVGDTIRLVLAGHNQIARFLDEFATRYGTFRGSMVILGDEPAVLFVSVALLLYQGPTSQGLMSVIPVIPGIGTNLP